MAQYSLNLRIAYTRDVKKSVGRVVKTGAVLTTGSRTEDIDRAGDQDRGDGE